METNNLRPPGTPASLEAAASSSPAPLAVFAWAAALCLPAATGCAQSTHPVEPAVLGAALPADSRQPDTLSLALARLDEPGPVAFRKILAADWAVERSGLINLEHPSAQAAQLEDGPEPIQVYFYEIEHPRHGAFLIDSGIARSVAERNDELPVRFPVSVALPVDKLEVHLDTKTYLESRRSPLSGVFLTHLHLDHILGLTDIPQDVPVYIGPGEADDRRFLHMLVRPTTDLNLHGFGPLRELKVNRPRKGRLASVDIFGDQSVLGIHVPGHTKGNMAFLIRATQGPQLLVGDASHTDWGWQHGVEPGTFNTDADQAARSLASLKKLAADYPTIEVHLGHQCVNHSGDASQIADKAGSERGL